MGRQHDYHPLTCDCPTCSVGQESCRVCGAIEDELPTDCPGYRMSEYQLRDVAAGVADFRDGRWVYPFVDEGRLSVGIRQPPPDYADGSLSNGEEVTPKVRSTGASGKGCGIGAKFHDWAEWVKSLIKRGT